MTDYTILPIQYDFIHAAACHIQHPHSKLSYTIHILKMCNCPMIPPFLLNFRTTFAYIIVHTFALVNICTNICSSFHVKNKPRTNNAVQRLVEQIKKWAPTRDARFEKSAPLHHSWVTCLYYHFIPKYIFLSTVIF